jgi:hypothetical protein
MGICHTIRPARETGLGAAAQWYPNPYVSESSDFLGGFVVTRSRYERFALLAAALLIAGCVSKPRQLMPTPVLYQEPSSAPVVAQPEEDRFGSTDVDLLYITDRGPETDPESTLPYGQTRSQSIAFGCGSFGTTDSHLQNQ